jgi:hypothetical protein
MGTAENISAGRGLKTPALMEEHIFKETDNKVLSRIFRQKTE